MEKPIVVKNQNGKQLMGVLHLPKTRKKIPLVVICEGFGGMKSQEKFVRLARGLVKRNIASFRFDFEGCGESEGEFRNITVKKEVSDLKTIMSLLFRKRSIDKNKVFFVGYSLGAVIITIFLAQTEFLSKGLVFWAPAFCQKDFFPLWYTPKEIEKWQKQGYFIRKEQVVKISYFKENKDKDYSSLLSKIQIPILILHGGKDDTVPVKFSKGLVKNYRNIKLKVYPRAEHKFEDYYIQKELICDTARWIGNHLK